MTLPVSNPVHPKVKAAGKVASVAALIFSALAAIGVVLPADVQNVATVIAVDVAAAVPVVVAYFKQA